MPLSHLEGSCIALDMRLHYSHHMIMAGTLDEMRRNPRNVRFDDLRKVCDRYFGAPRQKGSHLIYRMPWQGRPLVNIQTVRGMAKPYQVRQALKAIEKLEEIHGGID